MTAGARASATVAILAVAAAACSPSPSAAPGAAPAAGERRIGWADVVVQRDRDLVVDLSPSALAHDPSLGPIVRRARRMAAARAEVAAIGSTLLQAIEDADELVVALRSAEPLDGSMVVGGAPASVDPARLVDDRGELLYAVKSEARGVTELEPRARLARSARAALFVLPGRTWVLCAGDAVDRARAVFARAAPSAYHAAPHALIEVSPGEDLLLRIRSHAGPMLTPLVGRLGAATLAFRSEGEAFVTATLTYLDARAAARAEAPAKDLLGAFAGRYTPHLDFLRAASIARDGAVLRVEARLPPAALRRFADADDASLDPP